MEKTLKLVAIFIAVLAGTIFLNNGLKAEGTEVKFTYYSYYETGFSNGLTLDRNEIPTSLSNSGISYYGKVGIPGSTVILKNNSDIQIQAESVTDQYGKTRVLNVPKGSYTYSVIPPASLQYLGGVDATNATNPDIINVNSPFDIHKGYGEHIASVRGKIIDSNSNPVSQAEVLVTDTETGTIYTGTSDSNGEYVILGVNPGIINVEANHPFYGNIVIASEILKSKFENSSQGKVAEVLTLNDTIYLNNSQEESNSKKVKGASRSQTGSISGTVKDTNGNIVPNAQITIMGDLVNSDINGIYNFQNVTPGDYSLSVTAQRYAYWTGTTFTVTSGNNSVYDIVLTENPGWIGGMIRDSETGEIINSAVISLKNSSGVVITTTIDDLQRFVFNNVPSGKYTLYSHGNAGYYDSNDYPITIVGDDYQSIFISIDPRTGTLSGNIKYSDTNLPASNVVVVIKNSSGQEMGTAYTDINGNYLFSNIKPGTVTVSTPNQAGYIAPTILTKTVLSDQNTPNVDFLLVREKGSIEGVVTDVVTSNPVQGATIEVKDLNGISFGTAMTDVNGYYKINDVPSGNVTVSMSETNYITPSPESNIIVANSTVKTDFKVEREKGGIKGIVTSKNNGLPISGAIIKVYEPSNMTTVKQTVTTDNMGKYVISSVDIGTYIVTAEKTNYSNGSGQVIVTKRVDSTKDFELEDQIGDLEGLVTEAGTQNLLSGVKVTAIFGTNQFVAYTNAQGKYEFKNISVGPYTVTAENTNYTSDTKSSVIITVGNVTNQDLSLVPFKGNLTGIVTNIDTSLPLNNSQIEVVDNLGNIITTIKTGSDGKYLITDLKIGEYSVKFSHSDYYDQTATNVKIINAQTTTKDFKVKELSGKLTGVVYDLRTNLPVQSATVYISNSTISYSAVTNNKGEYEFLVSGGSYNTYAYKFGYTVDTKNPVIITKSSVATQDYYIENNTGTLIGTVIDKNTGAVVPNTTVTIKDLGGAIIATTISDANGNYKFINLSENKYAVEASKTGYDVDPIPNVSIKEKATTVQDISVAQNGIQPQEGSIIGKVVDETTKTPIPGSVVNLIDPQGNIVSTVNTNDTGDYAFNNVPAGNYKVEVSKPGYITKDVYPVVSTPATETTQNFELKKVLNTKGDLEGVVTDKNTNDKISGATITLKDPITGVIIDIVTTDVNGHYEFKNVEAKDYTISVNSPDYTNGVTGSVKVAVETTTQKNFELEKDTIIRKDSEISGVVTDSKTGLPVPGAKVTIEKDGVSTTIIVDENGRYVAVVLPGTYNVIAEKDGYNKLNPVTTIVPEGIKVVQNLTLIKTPVDQEADKNGNIIGHVKDKETGLPIKIGTVTIYDKNGNAVTEVKTDKNGKYVVNNLPDGTYVIKASKDGYDAETCTVVVIKNADNNVTDILLSKVKEDNNNTDNNTNNNNTTDKTDNNSTTVKTETAKKLPQTGGYSLELMLILSLAVITSGIVIKKNVLQK